MRNDMLTSLKPPTPVGSSVEFGGHIVPSIVVLDVSMLGKEVVAQNPSFECIGPRRLLLMYAKDGFSRRYCRSSQRTTASTTSSVQEARNSCYLAATLFG